MIKTTFNETRMEIDNWTTLVKHALEEKLGCHLADPCCLD